MKTLKRLSGPLSMLLIGLVFLGVGAGMLWHDHRFDRDGHTIEAEVKHKRKSKRTSGSGSKRRTAIDYEVVYTFEIVNRAPIRGEGTVSEETWNRLEVGDRLDIEYLRQDPNTNRPTDAESMVFPWIFAGVGGILTLFGGGVALRNVRKDPA